MRPPRALRMLLERSASRPELRAGLRAATATVLPLVVGELTGQLGFVWVAIGGWLGSLADTGGSYTTRALAVAAIGLIGGGAMLVASIASPGLGLALLFAVAMACSFLRVFGEGGTAVGTLLLVTFCMGLGLPLATHDALLRSALFAAGCGTSMVLSLFFWPIHPYAQAREAVAACFEALAQYARAVSAVLAGSSSEEAWPTMSRAQRTHVRHTLEAARHVLARTRADKQGETTRGNRLLGMLQAADLLLGDLAALADQLEAEAGRGAKPRSENAAALPGIEKALIAAAQSARVPLGWLGQPELNSLRASLNASPLVAELDGALSLALERPRLGDVLRTALRSGSLDLHHALRVAVTLTLAAFGARVLGLSRLHWVLVTVVLVLQPYPGATFRKGLQRVAGTVLGGAAASLAGHLLHSQLWTAALLYPLALFAVALKPVNYALFAFFVTPVFVLMAESVSGDWTLVATRILDTLFGGAMALAGAALLWPSWERERLSPVVGELLRKERAYLGVALRPGARPEDVVAARREAGLAVTATEAALQRLLDEPRAGLPGGDAPQVEALMSLCAAARRFSSAVTSAWSSGTAVVAEPLQAALNELVAAAEQERAPTLPNLRELPRALSRVALQTEALASALARLAA